MHLHWFTILCVVLALIAFGITMAVSNQDRGIMVAIFGVLAGIALVSFSTNEAQNTGLADRNRHEFNARNYTVLHQYGHSIWLKAGKYKLELQVRKDLAGKKQLVMPLAGGGSVVVGHAFVNALAKAPSGG